jgi:2-polyprenyl-3-methyl-5-hydroxy-6-metoxy-1,4-benzoquinol methylase
LFSGCKLIKTWSTPVRAQEEKLIPCTICVGLRFKKHLSCEGFAYVRCKCCDLVQMNPQPVPQDVQSRYRESHGTDYLSYERVNEEAFLRLQDLSLKDAGFYNLADPPLPENVNVYISPPPGTSVPGALAPGVLDIGCATGALLETLREKGWRTKGVEISTPQADYARMKRNLDVSSLPLEENHFPAESFQAVLASHLIEHLNDPASLVREVYRILAPGGRFFVTTPNIAGFQARFFGPRWRSAIFDHLYLFSKKTLNRMLEQTGFRTGKIVTWGGLAAGTASPHLKSFVDKAAKRFGFGDVMLIRARKGQRVF